MSEQVFPIKTKAANNFNLFPAFHIYRHFLVFYTFEIYRQQFIYKTEII